MAALQIAFNVLLARGFISGIPDELIEAAHVDGASTWVVFTRIIVPCHGRSSR
ncbi:ABC transporter permease subunit [Tessaracoccus coleopterorum]|uniref:ABC transporter permease subunit n=1 Tax=Tessaracoccus coleopterorum TaxID=2714950 RepID=UPI0038CD46D5